MSSKPLRWRFTRCQNLVALNWLRQYLTYGRGARLITGQSRNPGSSD